MCALINFTKHDFIRPKVIKVIIRYAVYDINMVTVMPTKYRISYWNNQMQQESLVKERNSKKKRTNITQLLAKLSNCRKVYMVEPQGGFFSEGRVCFGCNLYPDAPGPADIGLGRLEYRRCFHKLVQYVWDAVCGLDNQIEAFGVESQFRRQEGYSPPGTTALPQTVIEVLPFWNSEAAATLANLRKLTLTIDEKYGPEVSSKRSWSSNYDPMDALRQLLEAASDLQKLDL